MGAEDKYRKHAIDKDKKSLCVFVRACACVSVCLIISVSSLSPMSLPGSLLCSCDSEVLSFTVLKSRLVLSYRK